MPGTAAKNKPKKAANTRAKPAPSAKKPRATPPARGAAKAAKATKAAKPAARKTTTTKAAATAVTRSARSRRKAATPAQTSSVQTPPAKTAAGQAEGGGFSRRTGEFLGIILMALGLLALAALISLQFGRGNLMGPFGRMLALSLYALLGLGSYLVVLAVGFIGLRTLVGRTTIRWSTWAGYLGATLCGSILFHCLFPTYTIYGFTAGGKGGEIIGELLIALFSTAGTYLVTTVCMLLMLLAATESSMVTTAVGAGRFVTSLFRSVGSFFSRVGAQLRRIFTWQVGQAAQQDGTLALSPPPATDEEPEERVIEMEADLPEPVIHTPTPAVEKVDTPAPAAASAAKPPPRSKRKPEGPKIVETDFRQKGKKGNPLGTVVPLGDGDVRLPELSLLDTPQVTGGTLDRDAMQRKAERLFKALKNYGIQGVVTEIHPGPVVTMYEFKPAPGTKISKIAALDRDLAMTLEATSVRIVAPIPGKGTVGIEVPNLTRETVYLQELLADEVFTKAKSLLTLGLGKDISGRPTACDLAKAPHLLVAGSTGSGKSVGINTMLMSLLYRARPDQVRLILIDPKMLEFSTYEGIPHLLLPVVTDPKKANQALRWAVVEMERRYQLLAEAGVRNVDGYNRKVRAQLDLADKVVTQTPDPDTTGATPSEAADPNGLPPEELPFIVIVIDEFADLMMVAPKDVETSVARIAQKARAAGIHLIVATQRPSKDVITGLIKANFPTRAAFQVSSKIDSRVILDRNGAESLLGMGDMLYMGAGTAPERMHGAFVSTKEVQRVVAFLKEQARPVYNMDILKADEPEEGDEDDQEYDEFYDKAVAMVTQSRRASTSWIQRQLRIGYNRAARILEVMERDGVVGPQERGARNREVLVPPPPDL